MEPDPNTLTPGAGTPAPGAVGTSDGAPIAPVAATPPAAPAGATPPGAAAPAGVPAPATARGKRIEMDEQDFKDRLARASRKGLVEVFGTDDVASIQAKLARADELEKLEDDRQRAAMTEVERLQHDLARERQQVIRARGEARALREGQEIREQQSAVERIASRHIAPAYVGMAARELREHLRAVPPADLDRWGDREIAGWFQKFVGKRPEIAASSRTRQRAPIGASGPTPRPASSQNTPSGAGTNGSKTFRTGQDNSMSRAEAKEAARKLGYQW